jgi:hypothetical protein
VTTTLVFASMTRINLLDGNIRLSASAYRAVSSWLRAGVDTLIVIIVIAAMIGMIVIKYGSVLFGG